MPHFGVSHQDRRLFVQPTQPTSGETEAGNLWSDSDDGEFYIATSASTFALVGPGGGSSHALDSATHTDVGAVTEAKGQVLVNNGGTWLALDVGTDGQALLADSGEALGLVWGAAGGNHTLDASTHSDVADMTETRGDIIRRTSGGSWDKLAIGGSDAVLQSNGNDPLWGTLSYTQLSSRSHDHSASADGQTLKPLNFDFTSPTELTIAGGTVTVTQDYHRIDTESDASSDNLDFIDGGSDGRLLLLRSENDARDIIVRHNQNAGGTNNILLHNGKLISLNTVNASLLLRYDSALDTNGAWIEVSRTGWGELFFPTASLIFSSDEGEAIWDSDDDRLTIGDGTGTKYFIPTANISGDATMGTGGVVTVASSHAGGTHHAESHVLDAGKHTLSGQTDGNVLKATGATTFAFEADKAGISFVIDGGGSAIAAGVKGDVPVPFAGTITAARMYASDSGTAAHNGSITVEIWKDIFANFPPTQADDITNGGLTINGADTVEDTTLSSWTTTFSEGDVLRYRVGTAASTIERVTVSLFVNKT